MKKTLEEMISQHSYKEIKTQVCERCGEGLAEYIFPAVKKALEEGDGKLRNQILHDFLEVDSLRVCDQCGELMDEGWYLLLAGYACSDECAAKSEGITMEEFERYQIYKSDIIEYLEWNDDPRKIEELSKEECAEIIDCIAGQKEYCWTQWY